MKVCFINPPGDRYLYRGTICTYISKSRYVWKPKDFILLSSVIPSEWEAEYLDASINQINRESAFEWLERKKPDIIIVSASSISWNTDSLFIRDVREKFRSKKLYVFGEVFMENTMARYGEHYSDGIIYDPLRFDFSIGKSTKVIGQKDTKEIQTQIPRHHLFDSTKYRWPFVRKFKFGEVYTQFGCPFSCSYCTEATTNVTYRNHENVLTEIYSLWLSGYKELVFGDATFGNPRDNTKKILSGMIENKFNFSWSSYTHPAIMSNEMLDLAALSGCHTFVIGVDSADAQLLSNYGRRVPQDIIRNFVKECHARNISVCGDFILGFKEDTLASCKNTIDMSLELGVDYASYNIATPLLGSSIREDYKSRSLIQDISVGFDTAGLNGVFWNGSMSASDLSRLRNYAVRRFYLRPSYIWKRIKSIHSFEHLMLQMNEGYGVVLNLFKNTRKLEDGHL